MNVLNSVVGWLPARWQPYAKTIAAAVLAALTIVTTTVDGVPVWVTVVAAILTAPVVFATPNLDPEAARQDESTMPPEVPAGDSTLARNEVYGEGARPEGYEWAPRQFAAVPAAPRPSRKGRVFIVGALVLLGIVEMIGVFGDTDTVSGLTADVFHTSTAVGRAIFITAWVVFSLWYGWHIWWWGRVRKGKTRANAAK